MVLDGGGRLVAHRGHAVYDRGVCEHVGSTLVKAIESIQLQQEDWETITAHYADGRIVVRKLEGRGNAAKHVLAVVADASLNASFATVAVRVAANKLRAAFEGGGSSLSASQGPAVDSRPAGTGAASPSASSSSISDSRPNLSSTGLSWSKGSSVGSASGGTSRVPVADPASGAFLTRCAKELARHVGPMSKVYVQEAARRASPDAPFSLSLARELVDDLASQIEDPKDRSQFRSAALEKK
jgi:hypothetical protein